MCILLVSYYAELHLFSSTAQNTRFLASGLLEKGHEVRVICAGYKGETVIQDGYLLAEIPSTSPEWENRRCGVPTLENCELILQEADRKKCFAGIEQTYKKILSP